MSKEKTAVKSKGIAFDWKHMARLVLSLFVIAAAAALVLALVNQLTAETIAMREEAARQEAMTCVVPGANVFSDLYSNDDTVERISGAYNGTQFIGYCVEVSPNGFGGPISLMVGVNPDGAVTGVTILDHAETPGLGAKAENPDFLAQFNGKSGKIVLGKDEDSVNAITGATITSKAVTTGVNTATTAVIRHIAEGGQDIENDGL